MADKGVLVLRKRTLLEGICPEVVDLLKEKHVATHTFTELRKMGPWRRIEAAELMIAMNNDTVSYARNLLAVTAAGAAGKHRKAEARFHAHGVPGSTQ